MKKINVAILGLGTVGRGVYQILQEDAEKIAHKEHLQIFIKKVLSRSYHLDIPEEQKTANIEEIVNDPVAYPDDETLARSESFAELSIEATQQMNDLWLSVTTSNSNTTLYLVLTIAAVVAVILFFTIQNAARRRRKARRCRKWKTR